MNKNNPMILSFVSGKGGVGKTMLAVAAAKELSRSKKTLLIDLDFFNRGLTGLMQNDETVATITKPEFLSSPVKNEKEYWNIVEISNKLFSLSFPDVPENEVAALETMGSHKLESQLHNFVTTAANTVGCSAVVLDCHGGPDATSFAASRISDHTLLVSEPDRITMYGTLHFMRKLDRMSGKEKAKVSLIFNKVVEGYSTLFLNRIYKQKLSRYFDGRPLAAIYPLEVYLTKKFEKTPFLTYVFPNSMLCKKTQLLLHDLLKPTHPELLSTIIQNMPRCCKVFRRFSLGRIPLLFQPETTILTVFIFAIIAIGASLAIDYLSIEDDLYQKTTILYEIVTEIKNEPLRLYEPKEYYDANRLMDIREDILAYIAELQKDGSWSEIYNDRFNTASELPSFSQQLVSAQEFSFNPYILFTILVWVVLTFLYIWTIALDRIFTLSSREKHFSLLIVSYLGIFIMWTAPAFFIGMALHNIYPNFWSLLIEESFSAYKEKVFVNGLFVTIVFLIYCLIWVLQLYRAYRFFRYDDQRIGPIMRSGLAVLLISIPILSATFFPGF